MDETLNKLVKQLDLERLEVNLFRGQSGDFGGKHVFGGQVIGQALVAASRTVENRRPHSLHAYFLLGGDKGAPIVYEVDRIRDGNSFSARRVQAIQHGRPIFSMIVSFQVEEPGMEHQAPMPQVPLPEELEDSRIRLRAAAEKLGLPEAIKAAFSRSLAIEFRPVDAWNPLLPQVSEPKLAVWFKAVDRLADDPMLHRCMLAYASDFNLLGTTMRPHGRSWFQPDMVVASLDHALWFHRDARADEWLMYSQQSPSATSGRGLAIGHMFAEDGTLVATTAQEGMVRVKEG